MIYQKALVYKRIKLKINENMSRFTHVYTSHAQQQHSDMSVAQLCMSMYVYMYKYIYIYMCIYVNTYQHIYEKVAMRQEHHPQGFAGIV